METSTVYFSTKNFQKSVEKWSDVDKVYIYEKQKVDGHYTHTVEIIYNLVGVIDLPDFGDLLDEEN